jgi:hypothetical protein
MPVRKSISPIERHGQRVADTMREIQQFPVAMRDFEQPTPSYVKIRKLMFENEHFVPNLSI